MQNANGRATLMLTAMDVDSDDIKGGLLLSLAQVFIAITLGEKKMLLNNMTRVAITILLSANF